MAQLFANDWYRGHIKGEQECMIGALCCAGAALRWAGGGQAGRAGALAGGRAGCRAGRGQQGCQAAAGGPWLQPASGAAWCAAAGSRAGRAAGRSCTGELLPSSCTPSSGFGAQPAFPIPPFLQPPSPPSSPAGYSDSGKDAGRLAAAWGIYEVQERLTKVGRCGCRFRAVALFCSRGALER